MKERLKQQKLYMELLFAVWAMYPQYSFGRLVEELYWKGHGPDDRDLTLDGWCDEYQIEVMQRVLREGL